jgi:dynein heavy chain 1
MFAGITTTLFEEDGDKVVGMVSREGEQVAWSKPTIISEDPTIHVWLHKVESAMQTSLAELLLKAITDMETLDVQE